MATLVYKYGLRRPTGNAEIVQQQLYMANKYQNQLIEIECRRRKEVRRILAERDQVMSPLLSRHAAAWEAYKTAVEELKLRRKKERRRVGSKEERARLDDLRLSAKTLGDQVKVTRKTHILGDAAKQELQEVNAQAALEIKEARSGCGVYWGTYLQIENAMALATKMPLYRKGQPNDPLPKYFRGDGLIAVQLQHGLAPTKLLASADTRVQIKVKEPDSQIPLSNRQAQRRYGTLKLRIGSEGRDPLWAEWPLLMHRPLPEGALVQWAKVTCQHIADNDRWELHLTLRVPDDGYLQRPRWDGEVRTEKCGQGAVAINFGWRELPDGGRRVAYWRDDDGVEGELRMDPYVIGGLQKTASLQSIRDTALETARGQLCAWLKSQKIPENWKEQLDTVHAWKSPRRFARLCAEWEASRWDGDAEGFALLSDYIRDDRHLWRWEAHLRDQVLARRLHYYRVEAARLARRYKVLIIEKFNLSKVAKNPEAEEEGVAKPPRRQRVEVAVSELRSVLTQAFVGRGGQVAEVEPHLNTQRCVYCGCEDRWDPAPQVEHACIQCGKIWDQDSNNTKNILEKWEAAREPAGTVSSGVPKTLSKWAKLGRHETGASKKTSNVAAPQAN